MTSPISIILAAIFGALITGVASEKYKRHRDRSGVASAIAGEISAIIHMIQRLDLVTTYSSYVAKLQIKDETLPRSDDDKWEIPPIMAAYIDRIGCLGGDLPERIAQFYHYRNSIRIALFRLGNGDFNNGPNPKDDKLTQLNGCLKLWGDAESLGQHLVIELRRVARENWISW